MEQRIDTWALIQNDEFERAILQSNHDFEETGYDLHLRNQMYALFHLARYADAILLSERIVKIQEKITSSSDYIFRGIAYWLLGKKKEAIDAWEFSATCMYADAAGGVDTQLLLFFASLVNKDAATKSKVMKNLRRKAKSKRAVNWPGPLAQFALGDISETQLLESVSAISVLKERQLCEAHFVIALKKLEEDNFAECAKELQICIGYGPKSYLQRYYYLAKGILEQGMLSHYANQ
jgi:hypothetical protein